jgi:peptidylprolyl isomerase domain and WD repeat-containing protein 1
MHFAGDEVPVPNPLFDESGNFLLVPSLLGIKVINITTNSVSRIIGQPENTERFLAIALWQGLPKKVGECCGAAGDSAQEPMAHQQHGSGSGLVVSSTMS